MPHTSPFRLRYVAVPAFAPTIVNAVGHAAVLPVLALLARELGADVGQAAFVVALLGIGSLVASLPAGALVARVGERRALILAGVVEAAAMVLSALAPDLLVLGAATVVSGMAWTVFILARQGFLIAVAPVAMRARAMSTLGGSHRIGAFVGPLAGAGVLALTGDLRSVFWLAAAMAVLAAAVVWWAPDLPAQVEGRPGRRPGGSVGVLAVIARHRRVLLSVGSAVVVVAAARALRATFLPLWAEHVGISAAATSVVFGVAALAEIALFYPAGWAMDRHGRAVVAVPVVALMGIGIGLLPLAGALPLFVVLALLMAVGNGLGSGIVMTLGADTAPAEHRAQYLAGFRLAGDIGTTGGPLLVSAALTAVPLAAVCVGAGLACLLGSTWVGHRIRRIDRSRRAAVGAT